MRSICTLLFTGALASMLASACKSDKTSATSGGEQATGADSTDQATPVPAESTPGRANLPVPRRMRSSGGQPQAGESEPATEAGESAPAPADGRRARMAEMRKRFDADGDGQLNEDERTALRRESLAKRVTDMDSDGDGKLSRQEVESSPLGGRMSRDFQRIDKDGDSVLTTAEIEAARAERRSRWAERRERRGELDSQR